MRAIETLLLDEVAGVIFKLKIEIVFSSLVGMFDSVGLKVLSVKSNDVVLTIGDTGWTYIHGDDHRRQGVSASYSDVVDKAKPRDQK